MMNKYLLPGLLICYSLMAQAQDTGHHESCLTDALMDRYVEEHGPWGEIHTAPGNPARGGGQVVIPVVVHVVWNQSYLNTPDGVINYVFNLLDQDFNMENTNGADVRAAFQPVRGNPDIRFCLATVDPSGAPTTGITHTYTTASWFNPSTQADAMKMPPLGVSAWDPTRYVNIWVCDINGTTFAGNAGYSYLPVGTIPGSWRDGIVIDALTGFAPDDRSFTHEMGHYLGLKHPFDGNACSPGDGFSDTPPTNSATFSCSNTSLIKCGTLTQYENFMDYAGCGAMFTLQQSAYMNSVLNGVRSSLLSAPPACSLVGISENEPDVLRVFPNPTTGQVTVTRPTGSLASLRVVDSVGRTVHAEQLSAATATINVGELASGYYSLIVEQASRTTSKPLMVMH